MMAFWLLLRHIMCGVPLAVSIGLLLLNRQHSVDEQIQPSTQHDSRRSLDAWPGSLDSITIQITSIQDRLRTPEFAQFVVYQAPLLDRLNHVVQQLQTSTSKLRYLLVTDRLASELQTLQDASQMYDWHWSCPVFTSVHVVVQKTLKNLDSVINSTHHAWQACSDLLETMSTDRTEFQKSLYQDDGQLWWKMFTKKISSLKHDEQVKQGWKSTIEMMQRDMPATCRLIKNEMEHIQRSKSTVLDLSGTLREGMDQNVCSHPLAARLSEQYRTAIEPLFRVMMQHYTEQRR